MILAIVGIGIVILLFTMWYGYPASPRQGTIMIMSINVSKEGINLTGAFTGSAVWYSGYKVHSQSRNLYIQVRQSGFSFPSRSGDFVISIPGAYADIKNIYVEGASPDDQLLIWKEGEMVNRPQ